MRGRRGAGIDFLESGFGLVKRPLAVPKCLSSTRAAGPPIGLVQVWATCSGHRRRRLGAAPGHELLVILPQVAVENPHLSRCQ